MSEMTDGERATQAEVKAFKYKLLWEIAEAEKAGLTAVEILEQIKTVLKTAQ